MILHERNHPDTSTQQTTLFREGLHKQTLVEILRAATHEDPTRLLQQYNKDPLLTNRKIFIFETIPLETEFEQQTKEILGDSPIIPIVLVAHPTWLESHALHLNFYASHIMSDHLFIRAGDEPVAGMFVKKNDSPFLSVDIHQGLQTEWHKVGRDDTGILYALGLSVESDYPGHYTVNRFPIVLRPQWNMLVKPDGSLLSQEEMIREKTSLAKRIVDLELAYNHPEETISRFAQLSGAAEQPEKLLQLIKQNIERLRLTNDEHFQPIRRGKIGKPEFPMLVKEISDGWQLRISNINIPDGNLMEISLPDNYDVVGELVITIYQKEAEVSFQRWTEWTDPNGNILQFDNTQALVGPNQVFAILSLMEKDADVPEYATRIDHKNRKPHSNIKR